MAEVFLIFFKILETLFLFFLESFLMVLLVLFSKVRVLKFKFELVFEFLLGSPNYLFLDNLKSPLWLPLFYWDRAKSEFRPDLKLFFLTYIYKKLLSRFFILNFNVY